MDDRKNHLLCFQTPGTDQKLIFKKSIMGESFDIFTLKVAYKAFLTVYSVKGMPYKLFLERKSQNFPPS